MLEADAGAFDVEAALVDADAEAGDVEAEVAGAAAAEWVSPPALALDVSPAGAAVVSAFPFAAGAALPAPSLAAASPPEGDAAADALSTTTLSFCPAVATLGVRSSPHWRTKYTPPAANRATTTTATHHFPPPDEGCGAAPGLLGAVPSTLGTETSEFSFVRRVTLRLSWTMERAFSRCR